MLLHYPLKSLMRKQNSRGTVTATVSVVETLPGYWCQLCPLERDGSGHAPEKSSQKLAEIGPSWGGRMLGRKDIQIEAN